MRSLRWLALGVGILVAITGITLVWVCNSQRGADWAVGIARAVLADKLAILEVNGTLAGPLTLTGLRYSDAQAGIDVLVESATVDIALLELPAWRVHVQSALIDGARVRLTQRKPRPEVERRRLSLESPLDIVIDKLTVRAARIERESRELLTVNRATLAGHWTNTTVGITELDVRSPQGSVRLTGEVEDTGRAYVGTANAGFRWRAGDIDYAGALSAAGDPQRARLDAHLSSPFDARLSATLRQRESMPWQFELRVPAFEPRRALASDSPIRSTAAVLTGEGDHAEAQIRGEISVDDERIRIDPLRLTLEERAVNIAALTLRHVQRGGTLGATGHVRWDRKPFYAELETRWRDVRIPEKWAGQMLATRGDIKVSGNTAAFSAAGKLALGPPGRAADIELAIDGSPQRVQVERLSIVQRDGDLTASGRVVLKPRIAWQLEARAKRFDPGAFLVSWPGRLGFEIVSEGRMTPAGPSASLRLAKLDGTLRRRPVAGSADLTLSPSRVIAGTMRVRSGGSVIRLDGTRGEALDLRAVFNVTSLDDWLPDARGRLNGRFDVTGRWPDVRITGSARARELALGEATVRAMDVRADVTSPLHPSGSLRLTASDAAAAAFMFSAVRLELAGSETDHALRVEATGRPLGAELRARGKRLENGWEGSVDVLALAVTDMPRLALREPSQVMFADGTFSISESCLASERITLCLTAQRDASREVRASYIIEELPLGWAITLVRPDLPIALDAVLEGRGDVRRDPQGALFGDAVLTSASGSIAAAEATAEPLLSYQDLQIRARLQGDAANASASAGLSEGGGLEAELAVRDLRGAAPLLQGRGRIDIADIAPLALFAPQLASVQGRASAEAAVGGTLASPRITGAVRLSGLATELPTLGLQLREGSLEASMAANGEITVEGRVISGDGRLLFAGGGRLDSLLGVAIQGKDVLAANIPGARVVITPDLELTRTSERLRLAGKVLVPRAQIDLTKLPRGGAQRHSPDVVVVDDDTAEEEKARLPLNAEVTVVLGERVSLTGFGLDARLAGQVTVLESAGEEPVGSGEIRVEGTYKAYGQDLKIEQGRLLFASTPLDNPQIDLVAVRELPDVTARLAVTGTARRPLLTVSADPAMSPTQALSYLVAGRPLDELRGGEGDAVQSAARSLGGAAGNLLAKGLGRRLGIDEIGIEQSTEIGGSAFTIGEYLSPRLYLSYGVGLFEPGQIVTLRYELSRQLSIEARQGPQHQRAGINYRIEK